MLPAKSEKDALTDGHTDGRTDTQTQFVLMEGITQNCALFKVDRYKKFYYLGAKASNSLDPVQERHSVGSKLFAKVIRRQPKVATSMKKFKWQR